MARGELGPYGAKSNPSGSNYTPSRISLTKQDLIRGLKGLKIRQPNKKYSGASYKSGLPKQYEEQR